nr:unnamed protein product [Callosobruchus chinensis]
MTCLREADINVAEGKRKSRILASEAERQEQINKAAGEAAAILALAEARSNGLKLVACALKEERGPNAASLSIAEQYVKAFNKLAKTNNTLILPANAGDVSSLVTQLITISELRLRTRSPETVVDNEDPRRVNSLKLYNSITSLRILHSVSLIIQNCQLELTTSI